MSAGKLVGDRIRLDEPLGSGAMGTVWLATHLTLDARVAVKVLSAAVQGVAARRRFELEARAVAQLATPHVVKVFDYGVTDDGEPYIVMELLAGEDLAERLEREGRLSIEATARILTQAAKGLGVAHAAGIVHRDVKPANIFVAQVGAEELVKIVDFGIAKRVDGLGASLTHSGAMLGTPYFMSPEQLISPKRVDSRTDVWALGVVAYACLTGDVPFDGETLGALTIAINEGRYELPTERCPELPAAVDAWMATALARDPEARFATADDLARAFEDVARAPGPALELEAADTERDPSATIVATRSPRRGRRAAWSVLGLGASGLVGGVVWYGLAERPIAVQPIGPVPVSSSPSSPAPATSPAESAPSTSAVTSARPAPSSTALAKPSPTPPSNAKPNPPAASQVKPKGFGAACHAPWQCKSGHCVDGVCCDSACAFACFACTPSLKGGGMAGVCGPIPDRSDPQGDCPGPETCDGKGYCHLPKN